jgi:uncharacterized protein YggE
MKTKILFSIVLLTVISMLTLTGCGSAEAQTPTSSANGGPVNVNVNSQQGIWVSGQGSVSLTPDIATVVLGVSIQAAKVADAQSQAAEAMSKVMNALTSNGIAQKDIATQTYSINPVTRYDNSTQTTSIIGYQVTNLVSAIVRAIDKTGSIIDAVTTAAGDLARVNSISFSVDKPEQYYSQARTAAMNDAKTKAQQLASLAGVTLGRVTYIAENSAPIPVMRDISAPTAPSVPQATTPINPGQLIITLSVQVAYAIQ